MNCIRKTINGILVGGIAIVGLLAVSNFEYNRKYGSAPVVNHPIDSNPYNNGIEVAKDQDPNEVYANQQSKLYKKTKEGLLYYPEIY